MPTLTSVVLGDILVLGGLVLLAALLYDINVRPKVYRNFRREVWYLGSFVGVEAVLFGTGFILRAVSFDKLAWSPTLALVKQYTIELGWDMLLIFLLLIVLTTIVSAREIVESITDKNCSFIVGFGVGIIKAIVNKEWAAAPHMIATSAIAMMLVFLFFKLVSLPWRKEKVTEAML